MTQEQVLARLQESLNFAKSTERTLDAILYAENVTDRDNIKEVRLSAESLVFEIEELIERTAK